MIRQPAATQTLFAELSEQLAAFEATRSFANLAGSFTRKRVNGAIYWYFKTSAGASGQREYFVGPDNRATRALIDGYAAGSIEVVAEREQIDNLCAMLRQGGAIVTDVASARVIAGLAGAGVFRMGGMLVGTHAYLALGNVLGVRWTSALRTQDIDIAAPRVVRIAVPEMDVDLPRALDALNMGFLPVPGLDPRDPQTSFKIRGKSLRVDLLTPARGRRNDKPVPIARFKAAAQPLELLDYLLEAPLAVPLINGGASLVNVPDPARFALHKLMVSGRRQAIEQVKAAKDRQQAGEVIAVLHADRPGDLGLAAAALNRRTASWRSRLRRELARLPADLAPAVRSILRRLA